MSSPSASSSTCGATTRQLSTGNRRKLALLLAFLWPVELLVLDEPTSGLDPLMQHEFVGLVREARAAGATVFLSSHVLSEVQRTADRVVVLRSGRVVAQGTVEQLRRRARQRVEVWFDGAVPPRVTEIPGLVDTAVEDHHFTASLAGPIRPLLAFLAEQPVTGHAGGGAGPRGGLPGSLRGEAVSGLTAELRAGDRSAPSAAPPSSGRSRWRSWWRRPSRCGPRSRAARA